MTKSNKATISALLIEQAKDSLLLAIEVATLMILTKKYNWV